jgi:hypothetical protein
MKKLHMVAFTIIALVCATCSTSQKIETAATESSLPYEPGGMWMPKQIAEYHAETLKKMGLRIDPAVFADPLQFPLNAIVSLGGCSASFISPDGLVITNYHCVRGYLQYNSTEQNNLLHTGFIANSRNEEVSAGPTARVYVTTAITDVTDRMLKGIAEISDDWKRYKELEGRRKALTKEFENANPDSRCDVVSFYGGGAFYVITRLEIKDVRLVYAPHRGIGEFGGDIDNWMWPRHTGDFSLVRAYVARDGRPTSYSKDNVPFHPKAFLHIAKEGFKPGDLAFVVGYPGSTERLTTTMETQFDVNWSMPRYIELYQKYIDVLHKTAGNDPDLNIKAEGLFAGLENTKKNYIGVLDGVKKKNIVEEKFEKERQLRRWIQSSPDRREKYGQVIDDINALLEKAYKTREQDLITRLLGSGYFNPLINAAVQIVRMAEERPKPDMERDPDYQERNWQRLQQAQAQMQQTYSRVLSEALMVLTLKEGMALEERPEIIKTLFTGKAASEAEIQAKVKELFDNTKLEDQESRIKLLMHATTEELKQNNDSMIQFALRLSPLLEDIKNKRERLSGAMLMQRPLYYQALNELMKGNLAPDANGTIRISFGTVRGFKPQPDAKEYYPFTKVWEMAEKWAKNRGEQPFDAPKSIIDALEAGRFGSYVPKGFDQVPVDFLTDLDITGGNSGSATLNSKAEFAGIAFDGNIEGVASDLVFLPELTRAIHVDVRYILWILDAVEHADHLLREMGVEPEFAK